MNKLNSFGIANKNNITINNSYSDRKVFQNIQESLKEISDIFEAEDKRINELLPHQVLINKTGQHEQYRTEKIIRSLLNLGIPLVPTYEIAHATIKKLYERLNAVPALETYLSTKDVRKIVSLSIQECSTTKYSMSDLESWSNKYARRYGHNNHNVEIYWDRSDKVIDVSYEYIANEFLDDIIHEITHGNGIKSEISTSYRRDMATEILDFINHCDLYRIRYSLLKDMIIEIATQPPHPWMIYDSIRSDILKYDYDALDNNISTINQAIETNGEISIPQSAELEILHHASALILGMHNYFFGCYDLTAFYQLKEVIRTLQDSVSWNDAIKRSKISGLLADISFSGIEINRLVDLIDRLAINLRKKRLDSIEFACDVKLFGNYAVRIYELGNRSKIEEVLNSDWGKYNAEEVFVAVKPLLYSIFPYHKYNLTYEKNHFWISYSFVNLPSFESGDFKPNFFVIYADTPDEDITFLELLTKNSTKKSCNTILLITNDTKISTPLTRRINEYIDTNIVDSHYQLVCLTRDDLKSLYESKDKVLWLDKHLRIVMELPV